MADLIALAILSFSAISALVHLNTCMKLLILQRVLLKKRKKSILVTISAMTAGKAVTRRATRRRGRRRFWVKPGRVDLWWENMIGGICVSDEWQKNFRMPKDKFMELVDELRPYISPSPNSPRQTISAEKKVAIALYYLKDTGKVNMTANTFGVSICTVTCTLRQVCGAINDHLLKKYIHLPQDLHSLERTIAGWEQKTGFPMVLGAVDGTHIPIKQPYINSQDYFSYKMKYTLNVQGVCNYKGEFIDVDIRWPGATHDAKVFSYSFVNTALKQQAQPYVSKTLLPGRDKVGVLLLGDPAYPLFPYVMKEYATCTNNSQVIFNQMLRDARNPIECAYGRLKARWQILTTPINLKLEDVPLIILSCFVLHNWCEQHKVIIDENAVQLQIQQNRLMQSTGNDLRFNVSLAEGKAIRDIIKDYFSEQTD